MDHQPEEEQSLPENSLDVNNDHMTTRPDILILDDHQGAPNQKPEIDTQTPHGEHNQETGSDGNVNVEEKNLQSR